MSGPTQGLTYRDAGVDIDAADRLVDRIKAHAGRTHGAGVLTGIGGFASLFSLAEGAPEIRDPVLVSGTDGVGTKLVVAQKAGRHDTIGIDLVAMCVNDIVTTGARPLFFLDYLATGRVEPDVGAAIVSGVAKGCEDAGCALVGGETAEMPGMYRDGEYDLAGFAVGVVDRDAIIDGSAVAPGQSVVVVQSSGLHSNGYALARKALFEVAGYTIDSVVEGLERPLGDALLEPTIIYARAVQALLPLAPSSLAHITGGGLAANFARVLPDGVRAVLDRGTWTTPGIFDVVQRAGGVEDAEMERAFNMGAGLVAVVQDGPAAVRALEGAGYRGVVAGAIHAAEGEPGSVELQGERQR